MLPLSYAAPPPSCGGDLGIKKYFRHRDSSPRLCFHFQLQVHRRRDERRGDVQGHPQDVHRVRPGQPVPDPLQGQIPLCQYLFETRTGPKIRSYLI